VLELSNAYIGHCKRHGLGRWATKPIGLSDVDADKLVKGFADLKKRFPDRKLSKREKRVGGRHH